jgi:uncharacterized protein DUF4112
VSSSKPTVSVFPAYEQVELARKVPDRVLKPTTIQIERELEVFSQFMDNQFRVPVLGWRFGMNAIIDLVPGIGDFATSIIALYLLVSAVRYRVPKITLLRMALNIAIYFVGGLVPLAGDLFAIWWKPNMRNLNLLRARATVSAADAPQARVTDWLFVGGVVAFLLTLLFGSIIAAVTIIWLISTRVPFM